MPLHVHFSKDNIYTDLWSVDKCMCFEIAPQLSNQIELFRYPGRSKAVDTGSIFSMYFQLAYFMHAIQET